MHNQKSILNHLLPQMRSQLHRFCEKTIFNLTIILTATTWLSCKSTAPETGDSTSSIASTTTESSICGSSSDSATLDDIAFYTSTDGSRPQNIQFSVLQPSSAAFRPDLESSDYERSSQLSTPWLSQESCYAAWNNPENYTSTVEGFALGSPRYQRVRAKLPDVSELAYAKRPSSFDAFRRLDPVENAILHSAHATIGNRRRAIAKIETPDVMSAAAHMDLRDPKKVFFFARMIKIANEADKHSAQDRETAAALMKKFAEAPITINVFTSVKDGKVRVDHVECVDGNHRLVAGIIAGKWRSISDIPEEFLDIRVNGSRTSNRPNGSAEKDLHWLPAKIANESKFKEKFQEISASEFEQRVANNSGRYDANLLGVNEFFHVPAHYGASGASIAIRPEIPSSHSGMGSFTGVPMWQVVRRTFIRDGIVSMNEFEE